MNNSPGAEAGFNAPYPSREAFIEKYSQGKRQLVWRRVSADLETPVSAFLKLRPPQSQSQSQNSFLLESVEGGETLGRYSIIGLEPDLIWKADQGTAYIRQGDGDFVAQAGSVFDSLEALIQDSRIKLDENEQALLPAMSAGLFGYFGYDMVREVEHLPNRPEDALQMPDSWFVRPTILAVFDNVRQEINFITPVWPSDLQADEAYSKAVDLLNKTIERLSQPLSQEVEKVDQTALTFRSNTSETDYHAMVERARDYIRAGDIFQVVLSQRFTAPFVHNPFSLYRQLRRLNPSPFMFFLDFEIGSLIGSSPEILVRVRDGEITIRPIAGTMPRGKNRQQDRAHEEALLKDPKERAEHLMLLDLGRNDVGRSAQAGTVTVDKQFLVERYSHVMHIVSNVTGKLRDDISPVKALMNGFPAGTVSGAPKIRAMEIIDTLEKHARGPYAGCIGYFSADGNLDSCIALRTAIIKDGLMHIQAGAGIVADSDPVKEQAECEAKANALIGAAQAVVSTKTDY